MRSPVCDLLGIDFPLLAFSHCRDVVAAVTNAGGFGVLGASSHSPEQLDVELRWIDEHTGGRPYGADILVPAKVVGRGEDLSAADLAALVPDAHREFVAALLESHGVAAGPRLGGGAGRRPAGPARSGRGTDGRGLRPPHQADRQRPGSAARVDVGAGPSRRGAGRGPGGGQGARRAPAQRRRRHDRGPGQRGGRTHRDGLDPGPASRRCSRWSPVGSPCWPRAASSPAPRWRP